jgi:hypothetical protein
MCAGKGSLALFFAQLIAHRKLFLKCAIPSYRTVIEKK